MTKSGLLTTGDAARLSGLSVQHMIQCCNRGLLPCTKVPSGGRHRRIAPGDLLAFCAIHGWPVPEELRAMIREPVEQGRSPTAV